MKSVKNIVLIVFAVIALAGATTVARFQGTTQKNVRGQIQEEATVITEGQMTEKKRQHSKLFKHVGPKLSDIAAKQKGDVEVEEEVGDVIRLPEPAQRPPVFQSALCNADVVVIGTLVDKSSQLTDEGNFIFTDYEITVEEVIKNNVTAPIAVRNNITATRDGGVVQLNDRIFRAKRADFDPLLPGQRYLLFLRSVPSTDSYLMYGNGVFQLKDRKVFALGPGAREALVKRGSNEEDSFLNEIRAYATNGCQHRLNLAAIQTFQAH